MEERNHFSDSDSKENKSPKNKENVNEIDLKNLLPEAERLAEERQVFLGKAFSLILLNKFKSNRFEVFLRNFLEGYEGHCCSEKMLFLLRNNVLKFSQPIKLLFIFNFNNLNLKEKDKIFLEKWKELLLHGVNNLIDTINCQTQLALRFFAKKGGVDEDKKMKIKKEMERLVKLLEGVKSVKSVEEIAKLIESF
ncbi:hypothetical protein AUJ78_00385 [Candidatus Peregrinibacteria bacterium CG1_02_41_10]|nr:MAG: hypothetical protein AUJ78_00385 [Candidatus Peregrinibacteria bacterium CG1_02_41_10]